MYILFFAIILVLVAFIFFKNSFYENKEEKEYLPYVKRNYLMTQAEHNFYKVLEEAVVGKYHIVPQVKLSSIVEVNRYAKNKRTYRNKIDHKAVDFVLFEKQNFSPYLVIELDDTSHELPEREDRDSFVDKVLGKVGIRIEHVKTAYSYDLDIIRQLVSTQTASK